MKHLLKALKASESLTANGTVTEYLPQYGELTYTFNEGLSVRIVDDGDGLFQMTLDGFCFVVGVHTIDQIISYLVSI